jgi:hypothetical protein
LEKIFISMKATRKIIVPPSPSFLSRLSRKCGSFDVSQSSGSLRPVTGRVLYILTLFLSLRFQKIDDSSEIY